MLSSSKIDLREYVELDGGLPFSRWFDSLNVQAAAKVSVALEKISNGNLSNVKAVGGGVAEYKLDWGPGYRIYFGSDGNVLVILLGGGTKKKQSVDIVAAQERWMEYKRRKRRGAN